VPPACPILRVVRGPIPAATPPECSATS
jgi:hypothetical protein